MVLFRAVDIGAELFAMTAVCVRAQMLAQQGNTEATELADLFCREARSRIKTNFHRFYGRNDGATVSGRAARARRRARLAGAGDRRDHGGGAGEGGRRGAPGAARGSRPAGLTERSRRVGSSIS